jgi:hypothetical protein
MIKSIACPFPETIPDEGLLFPLVLVFEQVVYMQAVENEPLAYGHLAPFIERCQQSGRLQFLAPSPLGDQRERFLSLVNDMKHRGVDYTSQLSMLTLAGLTRRDHRESKHSIMASLLQKIDIKEKEEVELLLWQSRLILKLGELYDIEQADLNTALREITNRQDTLFAELCEEEDNPFVRPANMPNTNQETDGILIHRLKAWTRLCCQDRNALPGLLVTRHQAAMELMQEVYEKIYQQKVRLLISLELPCAPSLSGYEEFAAQPLMDEFPRLRKTLAAFSVGITKTQLQEMEQHLKEDQARWSQCISRHFPSGLDERCDLDLFFFPDISARQLCVESFNGGLLSDKEKDGEKGTGSVVGLLRTR